MIASDTDVKKVDKQTDTKLAEEIFGRLKQLASGHESLRMLPVSEYQCLFRDRGEILLLDIKQTTLSGESFWQQTMWM